jgi:simple sugar transport system permease protein
MWSDFFTTTAILATLASAIRLAVPYLFAAIGETFGQRSGVLNLGVDGIMLLGAFGAYYAILERGSPWLGLAVGMAVGALLGLGMAFITVNLQAEQGISGIGVFLFGLGFSDLLFQKLVGTPVPIGGFGKFELPVLGQLGRVGEEIFTQSIIVYAAFLLVPAAAYVLNRTTAGLNIRAVGENPEAADTLGVSVAKVRYGTIITGSTLAGIAGAALAIELGIFQQNLTNGQGFIAVALVYFGAWRPLGVLGGAMLYGLVAALILQWKTLGIIPQSASDIAAMAPALLTILALVIVGQRQRAPTALTKPYERGS